MKDTVWELRQARHRSTESTVLSFIGWNMDRERNVSRKGRRQENALSHEVWKALKTLPKSTVSREARRGTSKESNVVYFVRREERPPRTMRTLIGMEESEFANPRQLRREERFSGGKYGRQAGSKTGGQVTWLARCYFIRGKEDRRISRWMALVEENRIPQDRGWRKIWSSLVSQISTREDWPNVQPQANLGWHLLGLL